MKIRESVELVSGPVSPPPQPWDIDCSRDKVLTRQEFVRDCDVNVIIARCVKNGIPLPGPAEQAIFADVSEVGDFTDAVRRVKAAEEAFMALPADVRLEFNNDPASLIAFVQDEGNRPRAIELGLVPAPKDPPAPLPPAAPAGSPAAPAAVPPPAASPA